MSPPLELSGAELKVACFKVEGQPYAVDIMKIKQIIRPLKITRLPQAPGFVEGVIQLRGMVIPVIDLRKRFGLSAPDPKLDRKVIIAQVDRHVIGLLVDEVTEVISLPRTEIQPPPRMFKGIQSDYLHGVCRYREEILLLLNLDELLSREEKGSLSEEMLKPAKL